MSKPMSKDDPAYWMLFDGFQSKPDPSIFDPNCFICNDPEFAMMGLPLCYPCIICGGHVPADDCVCNNGHMQPQDPFDELEIRKEHNLEIPEWLLKLVEENE